MVVDALTIWLRVQALVWLPSLVVAAWFSSSPWHGARWAAAAAIAISFSALVAVLRAHRGPANAATIGRVAGLALLLCLHGSASPWLAWLLAVAVVAGDLLDGALARRFGATPGGALLDMEADQFTVLGLSLLVLAAGGGLHVLLMPLQRYAFVLAAWWWSLPASDPRPPDGDNRRARVICAVIMIGLLIAVLPCCPPWLRDVVTGLCVVLLIWSFSSDWSLLFAQRAAAGARG